MIAAEGVKGGLILHVPELDESIFGCRHDDDLERGGEGVLQLDEFECRDDVGVSRETHEQFLCNEIPHNDGGVLTTRVQLQLGGVVGQARDGSLVSKQVTLDDTTLNVPNYDVTILVTHCQSLIDETEGRYLDILIEEGVSHAFACIKYIKG